MAVVILSRNYYNKGMKVWTESVISPDFYY